MKLPLSNATVDRRRAFTLAEMLVVMAILVLLSGSIIMCSLYGLSMSYREQIWLSASDDSAQTLGKLMTDIRSGYEVYVGTGNTNGFTPITATNTLLAGNALKVFFSTSTASNAPWAIYYYETNNSTLCRTNYDGTSVGNFTFVSANALTNDNFIFTETDYLGNVLSNAVGTPIIRVYLSFTKLQNPQIDIAPGSAVDFYQIITTIASRNRP